MKNSNRVLSIILALVMLLSVFLSVNADNGYKVGDVNGDGIIDTADLSVLKTFLADSVSTTDAVNPNVNCDKNGTIDTVDLSDLKLSLSGNVVFPFIEADSTWAYLELMEDVEEAEVAPPPNAGDYAFVNNSTDNGGMIKVDGIAQYTKNRVGTLWFGKFDNGWPTRMRSENYIWLPAGTKITSEHEIWLYLYDSKTGWQHSWYTGEKWSDDQNPSAYTGSYTLEYDCFVRLTVQNYSAGLSASATQAQIDAVFNAVDIRVPAEKINEVYVHDPSAAIVVAYNDEKVSVLSDYGKVVKNGSLNYFFITDLHENVAVCNRQLNAINDMINTLAADGNPDNDIDFVALGGDLTTGMYTTTESIKLTLQRLLKPLNNCSVPVMILRGNHDDNTYYYMYGDSASDTYIGTLRDERSENYLEPAAAQEYLDKYAMDESAWYHFVLKNYASDNNTASVKTYSRVHDSRNTDSAYYYFNFSEKKTRVVFLDAIDYGKPTPKLNGATYWGYGADQMYWLINEALTAPDGWKYVFLSHQGYEADIEKINNAYTGFVEMDNIICAFNQRKAYDTGLTTVIDGKTVPVKCDFTAETNQIVSFQFGHHHGDRRFFDRYAGVANMTVGTSGQYSENKDESSFGMCGDQAVEPTRNTNQINEALFDLVSVDSEQVSGIRFGAGENVYIDIVPADDTAPRGMPLPLPEGYEIVDLDYSALTYTYGTIWANSYTSIGYDRSYKDRISTTNYVYVPAGTKLYQDGTSYKLYFFDDTTTIRTDYLTAAGCEIKSTYNSSWVEGTVITIEQNCWIRFTINDTDATKDYSVVNDGTKADALKLLSSLKFLVPVGSTELPKVVKSTTVPLGDPYDFDYTALTYAAGSLWAHNASTVVLDTQAHCINNIATTKFLFVPAGTILYSANGESHKIYFYDTNGAFDSGHMIDAGMTGMDDYNPDWITGKTVTTLKDCYIKYAISYGNGNTYENGKNAAEAATLVTELKMIVPKTATTMPYAVN